MTVEEKRLEHICERRNQLEAAMRKREIKKKSKSTAISLGIFAICIVLSLFFIICKTLNLITWSWLWILSPLWIPYAVVLLMILGVGIYSAVERRRKCLKRK